MANGVTIRGFKEFQAKLAKLPKHLLEEVDAVVEDAAGLWEQRAKQDAPTDQGRLRQSISWKAIKTGQWEIVSPVEYSAWVEWGTKTRVRVPPELSAYAAQFKGGGSGKDAKKMIYEWCRRKGIPENLWYVIYRSIMIKGVYPHPYFFVQAPFVEKQLFADLKRIVENYD